MQKIKNWKFIGTLERAAESPLSLCRESITWHNDFPPRDTSFSRCEDYWQLTAQLDSSTHAQRTSYHHSSCSQKAQNDDNDRRSDENYYLIELRLTTLNSSIVPSRPVPFSLLRRGERCYSVAGYVPFLAHYSSSSHRRHHHHHRLVTRENSKIHRRDSVVRSAMMFSMLSLGCL